MTNLSQAWRLGYHLPNWSVITQDWWVLYMAQGYQTDCVRATPKVPHDILKLLPNLIQEELIKFLEKQAI